jgi:hypothetical protein
MKRQIMWVSQHLEIDTMTGKLKENEEDGFRNSYHDCDDEDDDDEIQNVMSTPFGLWRVDDSFNPYKQFKLWMAHTNFTINKKTADTIKCIPGVEILSVLTRYRFMIGVGNLFSIREVRVAIEKTLGCSGERPLLISDAILKQKVLELKESLSKEEKWMIYVFPNGNIEHCTIKEGNKKFAEQQLIYRGAADHSNGILLESGDGD